MQELFDYTDDLMFSEIKTTLKDGVLKIVIPKTDKYHDIKLYIENE